MKKYFALLLCLWLVFSGCFVSYAEEDEAERIVAEYYALEECVSEGNYEEGMELCINMIAENPHNMHALYYGGLCCAGMGDDEAAAKTWETALKLNPRNETLLYALAAVYTSLGENEKALHYLGEYFELVPEDKSYIRDAEDNVFESLMELPGFEKFREITVILGGELLSFDVPPVITEGRTLVPVRKIFESMGAEVSFEEKTRTAVAVGDGVEIRIAADDGSAYVNGKKEKLDVCATIKDGRMLVPLRFVCEALNAEVFWDGENEIIYIYPPAVHGNSLLEDVEEELREKTGITAVDGIFPHPHIMPAEWGQIYFIMRSSGAMNMFAQMTEESKKKFLAALAEENMGHILGSSEIELCVVYDGNMYYSYLYDDASGEVSDMIFYSNGKKVNVIKQFLYEMNYYDYYLLPTDLQNASGIIKE